MNDIISTDFKLGILGGGQLGKMLIQAASAWDINTYVLDPDKTCPASELATQYFEGDFSDYDSVYEFGSSVDLITIEIEHVNTDALIRLKSEGKIVCPDPNVLNIIKDKGKQKEFYFTHNLPTSNYEIYVDKVSIIEDIKNDIIKIPFVQKTSRFGYDGRGVQVINSEEDLKYLLEGESVIESLVKIKKEMSVIVAQNDKNEIKAYEPFEMEFHKNANLIKYLISPARISEEVKSRAIELSKKTITALGIHGLLAVEMFLDENDNLLINESAPRPHNSGHHTIESAITSQYEQHLRAILGLPLGNTELLINSVMVNILGEDGYNGLVRYEGIDYCIGIDGVKVHIYGKKQTKPFRKMGHVTILDKDLERALIKAEKVKHSLRAVT
jgi:5-(carboxyamino)imidazole ribonucleotide synthase